MFGKRIPAYLRDVNDQLPDGWQLVEEVGPCSAGVTFCLTLRIAGAGGAVEWGLLLYQPRWLCRALTESVKEQGPVALFLADYCETNRLSQALHQAVDWVEGTDLPGFREILEAAGLWEQISEAYRAGTRFVIPAPERPDRPRRSW